MKLIGALLSLLTALMPALAGAEMPEIFKNPDDPKACETTLVEKICTDLNNPYTCKVRKSMRICEDEKKPDKYEINLLKPVNTENMDPVRYNIEELALSCSDLNNKETCIYQYTYSLCKDPLKPNKCHMYKTSGKRGNQIDDTIYKDFFKNDSEAIVCRSNVQGPTQTFIWGKRKTSLVGEILGGVLGIASILAAPVALALGPMHDQITNVALGASAELTTTVTSGVGNKVMGQDNIPSCLAQ